MLNALYYPTKFQFMASQYIKKCCSFLARKMSFILLFILLGKSKCHAHGYLHPQLLGKAFPPSSGFAGEFLLLPSSAGGSAPAASPELSPCPRSSRTLLPFSHLTSNTVCTFDTGI